MSGWSSERVELLKRLWSEGHSAAICARRIGGVTRNSVISKVHRLGLSGRATTSRMKPASVKRQADVSDVAQFGAARPRINARYFETAPPSQFPLPLVPPAECKEITDLEKDDCRYPVIRKKVHLFCGRPREKGSPYCLDHHRVCFVPVPPRRQEPVAPSTAPEVIRLRLVEKVEAA